MLSAILQFIVFAAIAGGAGYGIYRLMKKSGDIKDLPKL